MNFTEVAQWGNRVKGQDAEQVRSMVNTFCTQAKALDWSGADFENFVGNEVAAVEAAVAKLSDAIHAMGDSATRNASAQEQTSQTG